MPIFFSKTFRIALMLSLILSLIPTSALAATNNWQNVGSAGFSVGAAYDTSLALDSSGTPYVAYVDYANSYKATVMKFNGANWETVGSAGFSAGEANSTSLALDSSGTPYVAFQDGDNSNKATVMTFTALPSVTSSSPANGAAVGIYQQFICWLQ